MYIFNQYMKENFMNHLNSLHDEYCSLKDTINSSEIILLEKKLNYEFPEDIRLFLGIYRSVYFRDNCFFKFTENTDILLEKVSGYEKSITVEYLNGINPNNNHNDILEITRKYVSIKEDYLKDYIIIGGYTFGDLICLKRTEPEKNHIFYWDHEMLQGRLLYKMADSFYKFIMSIEIVDI